MKDFGRRIFVEVQYDIFKILSTKNIKSHFTKVYSIKGVDLKISLYTTEFYWPNPMEFLKSILPSLNRVNFCEMAFSI